MLQGDLGVAPAGWEGGSNQPLVAKAVPDVAVDPRVAALNAGVPGEGAGGHAPVPASEKCDQ